MKLKFTWSVEGFWVQEKELDDAVFLGGVKNAQEFGLEEKVIDMAVKNAGNWVTI